MSRTIRGRGRYDSRDGDLQSLTKDPYPKKQMMYRGDGWSSVARGGIGNKAGWKTRMPRWKYKQLLEQDID